MSTIKTSWTSSSALVSTVGMAVVTAVMETEIAVINVTVTAEYMGEGGVLGSLLIGISSGSMAGLGHYWSLLTRKLFRHDCFNSRVSKSDSERTFRAYLPPPNLCNKQDGH